MTIKAHFDGKAFVPDEPVDFPIGKSAEVHVDAPLVEFSGGPGGTVADFVARSRAQSGLPNLDAATLREASNTPNPQKQQAFAELRKAFRKNGDGNSGQR